MVPALAAVSVAQNGSAINLYPQDPAEIGSLPEEQSENFASEAFKAELVAHLRDMRAYAMSLTGNKTEAEDLVQDTVVKMLAYHGQFVEGTNMLAWMTVIMRNLFFTARTTRAKRQKKVPICADPDGVMAAYVGTMPTQEAQFLILDLQRGLSQISTDYRQSILWLGIEGVPMEEVCRRTGAPLGTVKSRSKRAREALAKAMMLEPDDLEPDPVMLGAAQGGYNHA